MTTEVEPMNWETIEGSIYDWIVELSKIVPRMIWEKQDVPQPEYPYASAIVTSVVKEGGRDELRTDTDLDRDTGEEIRTINTGPVQLALSISFYVDADHVANTGPNGTAAAMASKARSSLGMLSVIEHLREANIAIVRELAITDTSMVVNGEWLERATFDVLLRTTASMTEYAGYVNKVQVVNDDLGIDETFDADE